MNTIKIIDDPTIKTSELMDDFKKKFDVYCYWDNDELDKYFLPPNYITTREFNLSENPDILNKSWNDLKDQREDMMTFREYILFFEAYHKKTGKYPDNIGWTFFKDALPDGDVARGLWFPDYRQSEFYWSYAELCSPNIGARRAISNPSTLTSSSLESFTPDEIQKLKEFAKLLK